MKKCLKSGWWEVLYLSCIVMFVISAVIELSEEDGTIMVPLTYAGAALLIRIVKELANE